MSLWLQSRRAFLLLVVNALLAIVVLLKQITSLILNHNRAVLVRYYFNNSQVFSCVFTCAYVLIFVKILLAVSVRLLLRDCILVGVCVSITHGLVLLGIWVCCTFVSH